ncbi:hypothetical protein CLAFUW4_04092 [Fulvia fulva]|uniref:Tetrapyrrole methylase domain-containing protein n=1 Tax=Passalora fulva TaxID=5499 RepID=A0A9Q8P7C2_PASFU|nr:uncharacterized protein CLAFUR5_04055 [Fulvia fulva]KAK4626099.1 hypothetical protein CLAFUR4_04078 [Fulvia fulva]KAK4627956.1 hypothetical protein CLAFUR0_04079 [Fulvia fulva]UJO15737.1 hypothetical protein CLAFUR5_04055 [Fulvia fulva]WPV13308.1 hypothetical protein CLAFUW4_04092 [Fulvia fulva]WPV28090.1 hypothetical protein CLAFUW7_04081 [Fulvia fulva]
MPSQSIWSHIAELTRGGPVPKDVPHKGELVVVGTGIASLRQLTVEALDYIQRADVVFYATLDAVTEAFIKQHAKAAENLYQYYDTEKNRNATYTQMAETILASVRKGNMTVAVFYGHPGVFVTPSHRAIYIARQEGYKAKMLPGVSAEDCLYADLDIDPASSGCSMYEASFLLLEPDRLDSRHHLIIWQVGCVGKEAMVFDNKELYKLADYLEAEYGPKHPAIAYLAAIQPFNDSKMDHMTVEDLRDPEKVRSIPINAGTTLYVPPKKLPANPQAYKDIEIGYKLGLTSAFRISHPELDVAETYSEIEKGWCEELVSWTPPKSYIPNAATPALRRIAIKLALLHHRLHGSMSLEDIANAATAAEPSLTTDESDLLKQSVGFLDSMFNKERPPQSVTTSIVRSVVPPIVTQLNIIRKDGTVMMGDGKPSIYVF